MSRIKKELKELLDKIEKLDKFLDADPQSIVSLEQLKLIDKQLRVMREYAVILHLRLKSEKL